MPSKHLTNVIQNLGKKKFRDKYNLFKIEGEKMVDELLRSGLKIDTLIALPGWLANAGELPAGCTVMEANEREMGQVSTFKSSPRVIALAEVPPPVPPEAPVDELTVALNGIQDPGNLGTILRVCDWFGVRRVLCDRNCAGHLNPKSMQASMGAIFRVRVSYVNLLDFLPGRIGKGFPCYGTFLDGKNIYSSSLGDRGIVVMGNEGAGISPSIERLVTRRLTIPRVSLEAESLNVGVATGIVLSEFKRHTIKTNIIINNV
ncbi:MAG: RNA methyltransferase [Odoribacteraceae bacterium]|jgi:TrmH family RNA methyltransferase|nr:RNA methyltransferase [Odoribacteraceae bacterium]